MRPRDLTAALILAAPLVGCGVESFRPVTSSPPAVGICDLVAEPAQPGSVASFQAIASTDLQHGITLKDPACPGVGLRVGHPAEDADASVERFLDQLRLLAPHLTWRSARGSFTGRITLNASGKQRVALLTAHDFQEIADGP